MSEELQNPPVVDLDLIFQPIPGENPAGESLRYSGIYDEMREARRADENLAQGAWQTELKVCLLYTSPSPRDISGSRMPSSA